MKLNENLSKSIICEWDIQKPLNSNKSEMKDYNIISVVFFLMEDGYKKKDKYYNGLKLLIKDIPKVLPDFILRIYYDSSTEKQINELMMETPKSNIELFKYNIPELKNKSNYHYGVVGTLLRFLPLYNNNIHKADKVIILDIDNVLHDWYRKIINYLINNKINFAYRTRPCYSIKKRILCTNTKYYSIIASFIYQNISLPYNIFSDFLENIFINSHEGIIIDCGLKDKYSYGIDEIYINKYHLTYFYKNKIKICAVLFNHEDILTGLKDYIYLLSNMKDINIYIEFLQDFFNIFNIKYNFNLNKGKDLDSIKKELYDLLYNKSSWESNKKIIVKQLIKSKPKELYKLLLEALKLNLPQMKTLIKCLLTNIQLDLTKINLMLLETNFSDKIIIKDTRLIKLRNN